MITSKYIDLNTHPSGTVYHGRNAIPAMIAGLEALLASLAAFAALAKMSCESLEASMKEWSRGFANDIKGSFSKLANTKGRDP